LEFFKDHKLYNIAIYRLGGINEKYLEAIQKFLKEK